MLLVLDLDETLLYSTTKRLAYVPDYLVGENYVYARPGLKDFLDAISHGFRVAVWTSAVQGYAKRIVTHYFRRRCRWSSCGRGTDAPAASIGKRRRHIG